MAEKTQNAGDIAQKVAGLLAKQEELKPLCNLLTEKVFQLEEKKLNGSKVADATYRKARQELGDTESQLAAIDRMVVKLLDEGKDMLAAEVDEFKAELHKDRVNLIREQKEAVQSELMPIFETWLITRERIIGCREIPADRDYLNSLPGISYDLETRQRMNGHLEKLRKDPMMESTIATRLKAVDDDIKRINSGRMPDFNRLVVEAQKGAWKRKNQDRLKIGGAYTQLRGGAVAL